MAGKMRVRPDSAGEVMSWHPRLLPRRYRLVAPRRMLFSVPGCCSPTCAAPLTARERRPRSPAQDQALQLSWCANLRLNVHGADLAVRAA